MSLLGFNPFMVIQESVHNASQVRLASLSSCSTLENLIAQAKAGDMQAMAALVEQHQRLIYATLYQLAPERQDIADLTQEVLLRMCRSIKSLKNPKTFKFWLNRIITNLYYDELRKNPRHIRTVSLDAAGIVDLSDEPNDALARIKNIPDEQAFPDKLLLNAELNRLIHQAIANLPEQYRLAIVLRELQGLSYDDIAQLTQTQVGTVKSRLARARLKIQDELEPYLEML